jgi:uncharacterized protein YjbI with pentapeptide repeats
VWAIRGVIILGVVVLIASTVDKPLWDWLDLLIVPLVLAIGGYLFNSSQNRATQAAAERRAQDEALQAYLDHMSDMLMPKSADQPSLSGESPPESLRTLARARTLTVLRRLDGERKGRVLQFLYESRLIFAEDRVVLDLKGADLVEAGLRWAFLRATNLVETNLSGANLVDANLVEANLVEANLSGANLRGAILIEARLRGTNLSEANLSEADLREADLSHASLYKADLTQSDLSGADLSDAYPIEAKLSRAILHGAYLEDADLRGADLRGADLRGADLRDVQGVTDEELDQQAKSLEGATMPNGQKYEDWLKSREGDGG